MGNVFASLKGIGFSIYKSRIVVDSLGIRKGILARFDFGWKKKSAKKKKKIEKKIKGTTLRIPT